MKLVTKLINEKPIECEYDNFEDIRKAIIDTLTGDLRFYLDFSGGSCFDFKIKQDFLGVDLLEKTIKKAYVEYANDMCKVAKSYKKDIEEAAFSTSKQANEESSIMKVTTANSDDLAMWDKFASALGVILSTTTSGRICIYGKERAVNKLVALIDFYYAEQQLC